MKQIDLSDWTEAGAGAVGRSFNHRTDSSLMLKLYGSDFPVEYLHGELKAAELAYRLGVSCPQPGEVVIVDGCPGIIYHRIEGKKSFARTIGEDPSCTDEMAARFAALTRSIHSAKVGEGEIRTAAEMIGDILDAGLLEGGLREDVTSAMPLLEGSMLLHGDLHFGNAITDGTRDYLIDLGNLCTGPESLDLTMVMFTGAVNSDGLCRKLYHMSRETALEFWRQFKISYFGSETLPREMLEEIAAVMPLRIALFRRDMGPSPVIPACTEAVRRWRASLDDEFALGRHLEQVSREMGIEY